MACEHKKLKCVNCEIFYAECGEKLDLAEVVKPEKVTPAKRKAAAKKGAAKE